MLAPYSADTPVNDSTHCLVEVSSAVQPAPTDRGATVESRSAGQPAAADHAEVRTLEVAGLRVNTEEPPPTQSRENAVPANLRETALGGRLLQRMMAQDWLPISMQDIPKKWLTAATRAPQYLELSNLSAPCDLQMHLTGVSRALDKKKLIVLLDSR